MAVLRFRYFVGQINAVITEYNGTSPMTLPKVNMPADEVKKLQARLDAFNKAAEAHTNTPPLVLTGPEINALLGNSFQRSEGQGLCVAGGQRGSRDR